MARLPRELRREFRGETRGVTPVAALLLVATVGLVLASIAIVVLGLRPAAGPATVTNPTPTAPVAAVAPSATAPAASPTTAPAPAATATAPRPASPTTRPASPTVAATAERPSPGPVRPVVSHGGCAVALPVGFGEETPQGGYYPALDRSGFAALDAFDTANGRRTPEELAQGFATGTLSQVIQGYRQTGGGPTGGGYRIDYVATVSGKPGQGSFYLKEFGTLACGATVFLLDGSATPLAPSFDLMVLSLATAPGARPGTATPAR